LIRGVDGFFISWRWYFLKTGHIPKFLFGNGAGSPGDLQYLVNFVPLKVAVVTSLLKPTWNFLKTVNEIAKEKSSFS
jgi:hypothetical protein